MTPHLLDPDEPETMFHLLVDTEVPSLSVAELLRRYHREAVERAVREAQR